MFSNLFKVCLVSPVPPPFGGIGRWTCLLNDWMSKNKNVVISQVDISPRWRAFDDITVWKRIVGGGLQLLRDYIRFIFAVRGANIIHLTTSGQFAVIRDLLICITAMLIKIPVVYHLHFGRIPEIAKINSFEWRLISLAIRMSFVVLPLDVESARTISCHFLRKRLKLMPNPIDLDSLPSNVSTRQYIRYVLFLGWVLPSKGVEDLLSAWNSLKNEDLELLIAGPLSSPYRKHLTGFCSSHNVRFFGEVSHDKAIKLIENCDIFVLPSHTEAFPFVLLEAMALKKAIIATSVGAIPEMLDEGAGVLVNPKDISGLTSALDMLINNENMRTELGKCAYARVSSKYSADAVFSDLLQIWHDAAACYK